MNLTDKRYNQFHLVKEMLETGSIVKKFDIGRSKPIADAVKTKHKLFLTGEGSSRIFPAKNCMYNAKKLGLPVAISTDGGRQAAEYKLDDHVIVASSNSGKTKEIVKLINSLKENGNPEIYGLSANAGTPILDLSKQGFVLSCGGENAVGATKSVTEQALFYHSILENLSPTGLAKKLDKLGSAYNSVLEMKIDSKMTDAIANAGTIYFAGRNSGVAEELTLKTNEIARKKSDFLEGTYAVHGIEEIMDKTDVVIVIEPFKDEMEKFSDVLVKGVGMKVFAISSSKTIFPTIEIPELDSCNEYLQLACGWNLLVEAGTALGINLDKPVRARKIGNVM